MRGPWSRKTPRRISITPVVDQQAVVPVGKAKRVTIKTTSEKTVAKGS